MGPPCAHQETMHIHHCALIRYELGKAQGAWEQQPAGWEALPFLHNCELSFLLILKYHIFERKISKNQICLYFTIWLEAGVSRIGSVNPISIKNRSLKEVARFFSTYYTHTHTLHNICFSSRLVQKLLCFLQLQWQNTQVHLHQSNTLVRGTSTNSTFNPIIFI